MNISNAIRNVERVFMNFPDIASEEDIESFEIAVNALKKQKPMKVGVTHYHDGSIEESCRACYEIVTEAMNYCPYCGQAIDWED